jgi:TolB-like protein/Flp pilus assembly protein TadD
VVPFERGAGDLTRDPEGQPRTSEGPSPTAIERQLNTILSSETFVHSPQLCRFLRFVVEQEMAGKGGQLKEYVLAVQVLRKDESFDPRIDTAVRTEARRLRQKLAEYYQSEGRQDPVEIALPKGSYRAVSRTRLEPASPPAVPSKGSPRPLFRVASGAVLALVGAVGWWFWTTVTATPHVPSIAILPLENLSADPEQEYFSDGMTDALLTDLAKIHGLSVISRTSVMQYKRTKKPVHEIARELKVDYVVEGTVTRAGGRVRISAQLIAVRSDHHIWAESYERAGTDILSLQAEIAEAIAEQVHTHVTPQEQARLGGHPVNLEAQDLYLKGRFNWQTRDTGRLQASIEYFNQAIAKDQTYALPYVGLSDSYAVLGYQPDRKDYAELACRAARKAMELDAKLGDAYASLSQCVDQWDWHRREEYFRRALELSPSYSTAHQWYGAMLIGMGRERDGLFELRRAVELDPLGPSPNNELGFSLYLSHRYDQAIHQCRQTLEVFPGYVMPYTCLGFAYTAKGMYPQAIAAMETAVRLSGGSPPFAGLLAYARALGGDRNAVPRLLREYSGQKVTPVVLALLNVAAGDTDHAFEWLDRAVEERSFASETIAVHPVLDRLHSDPRWAALLRKMNLPN